MAPPSCISGPIARIVSQVPRTLIAIMRSHDLGRDLVVGLAADIVGPAGIGDDAVDGAHAVRRDLAPSSATEASEEMSVSTKWRR